MTTAPAGWYEHPSMARTLGYWDGATWTGHLSPMLAPEPEQSVLVAAGIVPEDPMRVVVLLGVISALVMPIVGAPIGLALRKSHPKDAKAILVLSLIGFGMWAFAALTW